MNMKRKTCRWNAVFLILLLLWLPGCQETGSETPRDDEGVTGPDAGGDAGTGSGLARGLVASYHAESTAAGIEILAAGGNAFDAFVAATFVEYVVSAGNTSAAGLLGALVHVASEDTDLYLDGGLDEVLDKGGIWSASDGNAGKAFNVPGAVAALLELSGRYGTLGRDRVLEPAIRTARDGFVVDLFFAGSVNLDKDLLEKTAYGVQTYLPGGEPVKAGSTLKLPKLAAFFEGLAQQGAAYMYSGPWAAEAVKVVGAAGGKLTAKDLARYKPAWLAPRRTTYRGFEVLAPAGRAYGGLWALVGLEVLEHTAVAPLGHYATGADALELMIRTVRAIHEEPWFFDAASLDDPAAVNKHLSPPYTTALWDRVHKALAFTPRPAGGSHSFHVIVADRSGNIVTGTNTIVGRAFGEGLFVQGVPLNAAGVLTGYTTAPGERRISPLSVHTVHKDGRPVAAFGAFGTSMIEIELAMLVDALDYRMSGPQIAASPRFGTFPYDWNTGAVDVTRNWLDPRVPEAVVTTLADRGLLFEVDPYADLGFGVALTIAGTEPHAGAIQTYGLPVFIETHPSK
jgi:gamma-glutamyltranspeptidase/glutathione hydrolase